MTEQKLMRTPLALASATLSLLLVAVPAPAFGQEQKSPPDYSRFLHGDHGEKNKKGKLNCKDCHAITGRQVQMTQLPPHKACMRCHVEQFTAKEQKICLVCHTDKVANKAPQLQKYPDFSRPTQFQAVMDHRVHVNPNDPAIAKFHMPAKCEACHKLSTDKMFMTVPGHPECQDCHNKLNVNPPMTDCVGCHKLLPLKTERTQDVTLRRVAGKFNHQHHEANPRNDERIACEKCHTAVMDSKSLATLPPPPMKQCTECHNGEIVNKKEIFSWGFCLKCHTPSVVTKKIRQPWPNRLQVLEGVAGSP